MKKNNVDDKDLTIKKLKEEIKKEKKLRFDYKDIIDFYNKVQQKDCKMNIATSQNFFNLVNEFFIKLENFIKKINLLIKQNPDKDMISYLQRVLKICYEIRKYKKFFKEKEKENMVEQDVCKILALILDLITYVKFDIRNNANEQIKNDFEDLVVSLYILLVIDTKEEDILSRKCCIECGMVMFFKLI